MPCFSFFLNDTKVQNVIQNFIAVMPNHQAMLLLGINAVLTFFIKLSIKGEFVPYSLPSSEGMFSVALEGEQRNQGIPFFTLLI